MSVNVTQIIAGPALVRYGAATFYSKDDIKLDTSHDTFDIEVDRFRKVDERTKERTVKVGLTLAGAWEHLGIVLPYSRTLLGELITPVKTIEAVDAAADTATITAHGFTAGTGVRLGTSGTIPAGLSVTLSYFLSVPDADTIKFHPTYADAIAGTSAVNFTSAGAGEHKLIVNQPLIIHTFAGRKLTLHNSAVTKLADLNLGTQETIWGDMEFEAFPLNNTDWSTANNIYTWENAPLVDTSFDPASIITAPYTVAWGASAPWSTMQPKAAVKISFDLSLEPVEVDGVGIVSRRFSGLGVTATFAPLNISESAMMDKLLFQGDGAARGKSIANGDDLNIYGPGNSPYVRLYGAALKGGPQLFSSKNDRIGDMQFIATRTFAEGVPNPLFYVGSSAPA